MPSRPLTVKAGLCAQKKHCLVSRLLWAYVALFGLLLTTVLFAAMWNYERLLRKDYQCAYQTNIETDEVRLEEKKKAKKIRLGLPVATATPDTFKTAP